MRPNTGTEAPTYEARDIPTTPKLDAANFTGAQALVYAEHQQGDLPENGNNECRSNMVPVRFSRAQCDPSGKFDIAVQVGDELIVRMDPAAFVDAFLAVVPRWFWKPKDERA